MEEKQRLARDAEHQQRMKSQQPLAVKPSSAPVSKPSVKDLSSTLLNTRIMPPKSNSLATASLGGGSSTFPAAPAGGSMFSGAGGRNTMGSAIMTPGMPPGTGTGLPSGVRPSYGSAMMTPGAGMTRNTGTGFQHGNSPAPNKNIDLSAFDNLLPSSNQSKKPMNAMMQQPRPVQPMGSGFGIPRQPAPAMTGGSMAGVMGNPGMMGNTRMAGVQPMAGGGFISPQGMLGQSGGMMGMGGSAGVKPKSDFDDLFG